MKLENLKGSDFLERVLIDPAIDECRSTKQGIIVAIRGPVVQAAQNTLPLYGLLANIAKLTSNYKGSLMDCGKSANGNIGWEVSNQ